MIFIYFLIEEIVGSDLFSWQCRDDCRWFRVNFFFFSSSGRDPAHNTSSSNLPSASSLHCYVVCWNSAFHRWGAGGSQEGVRQIMGSRRIPKTPEPATTIHKEGPGGTGSLSKVRVFAKRMSLEDGRINEYPVILRTKKSQALIQIFALHFIVSPWV